MKRARFTKFTITILIMAVTPITSFYSPLTAKVRGPCSNCHTMHYSQDGTQSPNWGSSGPFEFLLTNDCLGCHSASDGATWKDTITGAPIVYNISPPQYGARYGDGPYQGLAGGNFYWVEHVHDNRGHNIFPGNPDDKLSMAPGGTWGISCGTNNCHSNLDRPSSGTSYLDGRYGCVGCHMVSGASPAPRKKRWHHLDDTGPVVDSEEEGWFRFLSGHITGNGRGVSGIEDDDWEYTNSSSDHNEYLGKWVDSAIDGGFVFINENTITAFCTGCHGIFHMKKEGTKKWIRHPTDKPIPIDQGYGEYTTFDPLVPVARPSLSGWTGPSSSVNQGGTVQRDMAMCLSCHRAHGSPYPDLLRWDYDTIMTETGCVTCHTTKKGPGGS